MLFPVLDVSPDSSAKNDSAFLTLLSRFIACSRWLWLIEKAGGSGAV